MLQLNYAKIKKHLSTKGIESEMQAETNQLCAIQKIGEREYPLFFRIYDGDELLQLLAFLPCNTKPETVGDTARLLHMLNKEIDTPGFGMDENSHVVFYRCMIPAKNKEIDTKFFDAYLNATQLICQSFAPVVAAVSYGAATFEEIVKRSKEHGDGSVSKTQLGSD